MRINKIGNKSTACEIEHFIATVPWVKTKLSTLTFLSMTILDLFSKRQKRRRGEVPEVFVYNEIPRSLRVQLVQVLGDGLGKEGSYSGSELELIKEIHEALSREYGVFSLSTQHGESDWGAIANYLLQAENTEHAIDIVELCLRLIDTEIRNNPYRYEGRKTDSDAAIAEANGRLREHGVGFEFVNGEVIRVDSQIVHSEVVKPTLNLLSHEDYEGANDEFLKAHEHYRHKRYKECLVECLKSFESTMKTICEQKGWAFSKTDTARKLIETCMNNGLFATFMQSHVGNLRAILESGVPAMRNKLGGHGQGKTVTVVSESTARYALHLTAANILMLIESAGDGG